MRTPIAATATLVVITACATTFTTIPMAPSDRDPASRALEPGEGTITGSALVRQRGGGVVTCAGNEVFLIPGTESASRGLRQVFGGDEGYVRRGGSTTLGGGTLVLAPEPNRRSVCDAQGFFRFTDVRPGRWYVMTAVIWEVGENYQGGTLIGMVDLEDGGEADLVLSY